MKHLLFTLLFISSSLLAQSVGDFILPEKVSTTGRVTNRYWPKGVGKLWGTDASSLPQSITIGSGLTLTGGTLTSAGGGASALDDLTDVTITTATTGQVLRYNGSAWVNYTHDWLTTTTAASTYATIVNLALKAPLASPTFTGNVTAPNYVLSDSAVDTLSAIQYGIGWKDDRFTLQTPDAALQTFTTGDPEEGVLYWAGRLQVGSLEAADITGEISADLITSGTIDSAIFRTSTPQPLRAFNDGSSYAGAYGITYGNTGPTGANEPTTPGTYYPQILVIDGDPNVNYLQGRNRTAAQFISDLALTIGTNVQAYDADLTTYAGITPSSNVQSLLGAADYSAMRTLLGLVIGTNVQAYDADLTTYAGITPAANVQSLLGAADYSAMRTLLGLVIGTNVQAYDADLTTYAGITPAANTQSLLGAADYSAMRTLLGLVIGTNVQAYDADLTTYAGITPAANTQSLLGAADYSAMRTLLGLVIGTNVQAYDADLADLADGSLTGTLVAAGSTSARGTVELATDGETAASVVVQGNDNRLVDAERVEIGVAISDETTALTTGTAKATFRMPHAMTVTAVRMSLTTVSSSGTPTVDINETGSTILSTKLTCDVSEKTSKTAAAAAVISDATLADDAEITIDIDTAGTGAAGAKIWIIGTR